MGILEFLTRSLHRCLQISGKNAENWLHRLYAVEIIVIQILS